MAKKQGSAKPARKPNPATLLDPHPAGLKRRAAIILAMENGGTRKEACSAAGITTQTLWFYLRQPRNAEFKALFEQAHDRGVTLHLKNICDQSKSDWKASAWWLERQHPKRFGKRNPDNVTPEQLAKSVTGVVAALLKAVPSEHHTAMLAAVDAELALQGGKRAASQGRES